MTSIRRLYSGPGFNLVRGVHLDKRFKAQLKALNEKLAARTMTLVEYAVELEALVKIGPINLDGVTRKTIAGYIAGVVEGEGSINVSIKKAETSCSGWRLDPEFSITQHVNGASMLLLCLRYFGAGYITYKSGSNATLVYRITNNHLLVNLIVPFYRESVENYRTTNQGTRVENFHDLVTRIIAGEQVDEEKFVNVLLPLWDSLRVQVGQKNQSFADLASAQAAVKENFASWRLSHPPGARPCTPGPRGAGEVPTPLL